jgi:TonB family protein
MFDYAIGHYQNHPPSRRMLASWALSILSHAAAVLILYQYPELLHDGVHIWSQRPAPPQAAQEYRWRSLAVVNSRMEMPPIEEIRKNLYDWDRAKAQAEIRKPIRINLPTDLIDPVPVSPPKPQTPPAPANPVVTAPGNTAMSAPLPAGNAARTEVAETKKAPPTATPDVPPKQIPRGGIEPTVPPANAGAGPGSGGAARGNSSGSGSKDAQDAAQQIRAQGPVFFDAKGFNLDDYANLVRERIKQNWFFPSNLRNNQGSATILFYITKDGQVTGARIDVPSGSDSLNMSALSAVWGSAPFPPLPKGFPADRVGARLVFAYNERQ